MNRFYFTQADAKGVILNLHLADYEELDPCTGSKEMVFIDTLEKTYYLIDEKSLADSKEIVSAKYGEQVHLTTLKDIEKWEK